MRSLAARRAVRLIGLVAVTLGLVAVVVRFGPTAALSLSLAAPATDAWLARVLPDPVREEIVIESGGRRLQADVYRPTAPRAAMLLVHGLSRAGRPREHPLGERDPER